MFWGPFFAAVLPVAPNDIASRLSSSDHAADIQRVVAGVQADPHQVCPSLETTPTSPCTGGADREGLKATETHSGMKTPASRSGKYKPFFFFNLLLFRIALQKNKHIVWQAQPKVIESLGKTRGKDSAVVTPNNEDLVLICAHYFAVWAAHNLHAMRRNQLRSSRRQSAIKEFIYLFY